MGARFPWKYLQYAILIIAVVAAIAIPTPDAATMLKFMAPMVALVAALVRRKRL
jgi:hypothetical protein